MHMYKLTAYVFVGYTTTDQKDVEGAENGAITWPASNPLWYICMLVHAFYVI